MTIGQYDIILHRIAFENICGKRCLELLTDKKVANDGVKPEETIEQKSVFMQKEFFSKVPSGSTEWRAEQVFLTKNK